MSIVPRQAAPVPQWAQQIYGNGEPLAAAMGGGSPAQGYSGTDWSRTGQQPGKMVWQSNGTSTYTDPVTGEPVTMDNGGKWVWQSATGNLAVPPGFTQPSYASQYGPQWRGAAYGPSGRESAMYGQGGGWQQPGTTYYGPGFEPPVTLPQDPYTDPNVNPPPLPPRVSDPVSIPGQPITTYLPKPYSRKTGTVRGPDTIGSPRPFSPGVGVPDNPGETASKYRWPPPMTKGWV